MKSSKKIRKTQVESASISDVINSLGYIPENTSKKGVNDGYASLDSAGKVPIAQLPISTVDYKGLYNALTNTPFLIDGVGNTGDTYRVSVAGPGVNGLNFTIGDTVIYNGSTWEKLNTANDVVTSVFGRIGNVTAQLGDYSTSQVTEVTNRRYQTDNQDLFNDATSSIQTQLNTKALDSTVVHLAGTETVTGAKTFTTNINIDANTFSVTPTSIAAERRILWDDTAGTASIRLKGGNVDIPLGQKIVSRSINKQGTNVLGANYQAVYLFGGQGHDPTFKLAQANSSATSNIVLGLVAENINNNQEGFVTFRGEITNVNTTGALQGESWVDGDVLYLSATVAGGLTKVKPLSPNRLVKVGVVTNVHATQGVIYVRIDQSELISELNDVSITSIADKQFLSYDNATSLWKNRLLVLNDLPVGTELQSNKQNTLNVDGTGIKYPTVDAVNDEFDYVQSTGVLSGGIISINADPTKFNISAGVGYVVNSTNLANVTRTKVTWGAFTAVTVTNLLTQPVTYVSIDSSGNIFQQTTFPTVAERRQRMIIGRLNHSTLTTILFVDTFPDMLQGPMSQYFDLTNAMGPFNIEGNIITANGANLSLNKSIGSQFNASFNYAVDNQSPNNITNPALVLASFRHQNRNSTDVSTITIIDPTNYDVAGVTTAVPNPVATATAMRVYLFPSNQLRVQRGQATYTNLAAAVSGYKNETFVENPTNTGVAIWVATICIQKNCTSLLDTTTSRIILEPKFGGSSGAAGITTASLQSAYNNSVNPEILTNTALGSLSVRRGSAADTDNVLDVQNNAGTINMSVKGNGSTTIGDGAISTTSIFSVFSTTQGTVPYPRMTQAQRLAIVSPVVGLSVYQTDGTEGIYVNSSTGWKVLTWV